MLVLTRKIHERIVIGDSVVLTVVQVNGSSVRIGIEAPADITIVREELLSDPDSQCAGRPRSAADPRAVAPSPSLPVGDAR